jgi:putative MATE family efflux protein
MKNRNDLTKGNITEKLVKLAVPVMGTSFVQMAYNLADMAWIGRLGGLEVAAVGTAGFYAWLSFGFMILAKIGTQVNVARNVGKDDYEKAGRYATAGLQAVMLIGILFAATALIFRENLIGFFNIDDAYVNRLAVEYLSIIVFGLIFNFINEVFSGIIIGAGESKAPFKINAVGLGVNIIIDPILIFGLFGVPQLGVRGAAIATASSQLIVTVIFIMHIYKADYPFFEFNIFKGFYVKEIIENGKIGLPVSIHSLLFTLFSMGIARLVAVWGPIPVGVQRVGGQIESITWRTSEGFSSALSSFTGQNYGAGEKERVKKGYFSSLKLMAVFGTFTTLLLVFCARPIFSLFIPERQALLIGIDYLKILGISQVLMSLEIMTQGAFAGFGKTITPSLVSIIFNGLRIPLALYLSMETSLGLNGVWWSISITSMIKGIIIVSWFLIILKKYLKQGVIIDDKRDKNKKICKEV